MGRKKIEIEHIVDERIRRVTFKKRRIGLLKKAIQLSKLTGAQVQLKVYNDMDQSYIEYFSKNENDFDNLSKYSERVKEYSKFYNQHYELVAQIEERVTKYGTATCTNKVLTKREQEFQENLENQVDSINLMQLFSLAKRSHDISDNNNANRTNASKSDTCTTKNETKNATDFGQMVETSKKVVGQKRQRTEDAEPTDSTFFNYFTLQQKQSWGSDLRPVSTYSTASKNGQTSEQSPNAANPNTAVAQISGDKFGYNMEQSDKHAEMIDDIGERLKRLVQRCDPSLNQTENGAAQTLQQQTYATGQKQLDLTTPDRASTNQHDVRQVTDNGSQGIQENGHGMVHLSEKYQRLITLNQMNQINISQETTKKLSKIPNGQHMQMSHVRDLKFQNKVDANPNSEIPESHLQMPLQQREIDISKFTRNSQQIVERHQRVMNQGQENYAGQDVLMTIQDRQNMQSGSQSGRNFNVLKQMLSMSNNGKDGVSAAHTQMNGASKPMITQSDRQIGPANLKSIIKSAYEAHHKKAQAGNQGQAGFQNYSGKANGQVQSMRCLNVSSVKALKSSHKGL